MSRFLVNHAPGNQEAGRQQDAGDEKEFPGHDLLLIGAVAAARIQGAGSRLRQSSGPSQLRLRLHLYEVIRELFHTCNGSWQPSLMIAAARPEAKNSSNILPATTER